MYRQRNVRNRRAQKRVTEATQQRPTLNITNIWMNLFGQQKLFQKRRSTVSMRSHQANQMLTLQRHRQYCQRRLNRSSSSSSMIMKMPIVRRIQHRSRHLTSHTRPDWLACDWRMHSAMPSHTVAADWLICQLEQAFVRLTCKDWTIDWSLCQTYWHLSKCWKWQWCGISFTLQWNKNRFAKISLLIIARRRDFGLSIIPNFSPM